MAGLLNHTDLIGLDLSVDDAVRQQIEAKRRLQESADQKICQLFLQGKCTSGMQCAFRHMRHGARAEVCKHWIRAMCKKNELCEYVHIYDMSRMPKCQFFSTYGTCIAGEDCNFLHLAPQVVIRDCPAYDRGFCRRGPNCRLRHVRRLLCPKYLAGFCPDGPKCTLAHPKFNPYFGLLGEGGDDDEPDPTARAGGPTQPTAAAVCGRCKGVGHFTHQCPHAGKATGDQ